ncbi:MAG: hypothetical protein QX198_17690 [Methylococcaceae bacterium]
MKIKSTKMTWLYIIPVLLLPVLVQAESTGTGNIAASKAADQREALAKKAAQAQARKAAAEQQKAMQTQTQTPSSQEQPPIEPNKN